MDVFMMKGSNSIWFRTDLYVRTVGVNPPPSQPVEITEIGNNELCNEETCHCVINLSHTKLTKQ